MAHYKRKNSCSPKRWFHRNNYSTPYKNAYAGWGSTHRSAREEMKRALLKERDDHGL